MRPKINSEVAVGDNAQGRRPLQPAAAGPAQH